jgi:hypothetical protein
VTAAIKTVGSLRSLRLDVTDDFEPITREALSYAQATVAAISPTASVSVETVPELSGGAGRRPYRLVVDDQPCPLVRYDYPSDSSDDERVNELCWQFFWTLFDRMQPMAADMSLVLVGDGTTNDAVQAVAEVSDAIGLKLPVPIVEPGGCDQSGGLRLRIGALTTPVFATPADHRRGARSLRGTLRRAAAALVTERTADALLQRVGRQRSRLAKAVRERYGLPMFTEVLRCLVDEGVSLNAARGLCEGLMAANSVLPPDVDESIIFAPPVLGVAWSTSPLAGLAPAEWAQCAREALKSQNTMACTAPALDFRESWGMTLYRPEWTIEVGLLDPALERRVRTEQIGPDDAETIVDAVCAELGYTSQGTPVPLLTTASARHRLWRIVRHALPWLAILAYQELAPEANITPLFRVSLP